ncbi:hypothetical protein FFLO_03972 [Filobasidium floriforme]|uniref:Transmembrane protein n=1 Tax=Filobasidium floriforme TaxID=5210 RepID=A0A8K0NMR5_9TREE|nr:hypothetical protein FFLO_03972 [Filobasidium floriforme]
MYNMNPDLLYNLNFVGLCMIQFASVTTCMPAYRAVRYGDKDIMSTIPSLTIAIEAAFLWAISGGLFIINNKIRNRTQENKIALPGLSIALVGPQCIGLLIGNLKLTSDIRETSCYSGDFCWDARRASAWGWVLLLLVALLLLLWMSVLLSAPFIRIGGTTNPNSDDGNQAEQLLEDDDEARKASILS